MQSDWKKKTLNGISFHFFSIAVEPLFPQLCLKGLPKDFRSGTPQLGQENARDKLRRRFSDEQSIEVENGEQSSLKAANSIMTM